MQNLPGVSGLWNLPSDGMGRWFPTEPIVHSRAIFDHMLRHNEWQPSRDGFPPADDILSKMTETVTTDTWDNSGADFIQTSYTCPAWGEDISSNGYLKKGMVVFGPHFKHVGSGNTVTCIALLRINQIMQNEYDTYRRALANGDSNAMQWKNYMDEHGEEKLEAYHRRVLKDPDHHADGLGEFYEMSKRSTYRWLSRIGIETYVRYLGVAIEVTPLSVNTVNGMTPEFTSAVNVGTGKRIQVTNVFAPTPDMQVGSSFGLYLRRKPIIDANGDYAYGAYQYVPWGGYRTPRPSDADRSYLDEGGHLCKTTRFITIGKVLMPPEGTSPESTMTTATNTSTRMDEQLAASTHEMLPSFYSIML